eukprot:Platyproteum_vivax@DN1030_c0_g1_i1.p1
MANENLRVWANSVRITIEETKIVKAMMCLRAPTLNPNYDTSDGFDLCEVTVIGVNFDPHLTIDNYINSRIKLARATIANIMRIQHLLNKDQLTKLFKTMVWPILEYGCLSYLSAGTAQLQKLEQLQFGFVEKANIDPLQPLAYGFLVLLPLQMPCA